MSRSHFSRILLLCAAALGLARDVRAQNGDLDILSRTVPPIVMIQQDTSGSMKNIILPDKYLADRGNTYPTSQVWFNTANDVTNRPASFIAATSTYYCGSTSGCVANKVNTASVEDYRPTCQLFSSTSTTTANNSVCTAVATPTNATCKNGGTTIADDDADDDDPQGGAATIRCWGVPGGCANVPAGIACTTASRARKKTSSTSVSQPYTIITMPDVSYTSTTDYPPNYLWWMMQEIYLGHTPVAFSGIDRLGSAKAAIAQLVNNVNVDGMPPRVKFGLSRYDSGANGGYTVVVPDLNNKATLLATLATLPSSGGTPLSETLVDTARYLAGADKLGKYPAYNRNLTGGTGGAVPPSPVTSSCEKLFVVAITDGLPTSDNNDHYKTSAPNGGDSFKQTFPGATNTDYGSYLDDVAAKLYATDLRTSLSGNQNVITYTVGFTIASPLLQAAATAGHGLYFQSNNSDELADSLTQAITDIVSKNTTLTAATVPSTRSAFGNGFYTAYFVPSGRKSVWPGKLEAYTLAPDLTVLDDNNAPAIDPATNLFFEPRHPHWDLGATLLADYAARTVYTTRGATRVPFTAGNFIDPNDPNAATDPNAPVATRITPAMLNLTAADMTQYPADANDPTVKDAAQPASLTTLGRSIIQWVRGTDAFNEDNDPNGDITDARSFVFGDVFHSSPVAVGPPLPFLRFEKGFGPPPATPTGANFMTTFAHRDRLLYVGANDGMLHAADAGKFVDPNGTGGGDEYYTAGSGHEIFGYVPGFLLNKIKLLPRNDVAKTYYVDGAPTAADAWIDYNNNGVKDGSDWTTVLLTPMREGGEGILALDVTDPAASSGSHFPFPRLMFEFTNAGLGQTWSRPIITRVKMRGSVGSGDNCAASTDPNTPNGDCFEQWVAIFGAGYRNEANPNMGVYISDPNNAGYAKSKGVFIVRLSDGAIIARLAPTFPTTPTPPPSSGTFSAMKYAMPAEPSVLDLNTDGYADVVYMGDVGGQMWKWDIHNVGVLNTTTGMVPTSVWPAGVIFAAPITDMGSGINHYHSIFQGTGAAISGGSLYLSFASGERADLGYSGAAGSDPNDIVGLNDDNNRFWVMKEACPPYKAGCTAFPTTATESNLTDITTTASDNDPNDLGYFFRVKDGEKFITDDIIFGGVVVTLSYLPDLPGSGSDNDCALGGTTIEYAWTLANGVGVLSAGTDDGSGPPSTDPPVRSKTLGNGAPTNPRLTISKTDDGKIVVNSTVQTSTGEVKHPDGLPPGFDPVQEIFWRQDF